MRSDQTTRAPQASAPSSRVLTLAEGLYALPNTFELDGRPVTTHPASARGWAPVNSFVYTGDGEALVIDTGYGMHEASVLEQLGSLIAPETSVTLLVLRSSQYCSVSNSRAISERFRVDRLIMGGGILPEDIHEWLHFQPGNVAWRQSTADSKLAKAQGWSPMGATSIGVPGGRTLELVRPELQLLSTYWLYDGDAKTLFTSDAFSHMWRESEDGPWAAIDPQDAPTVDELCEFLVGSHYWWLAGARTRTIRADLRRVLQTYDVAQVAPATGCVLVGRDVVERHFALMDQALERLADWTPIDELGDAA